MKTIIWTITKTMNCGRNRRCSLDVNGICFSLCLKGRDVGAFSPYLMKDNVLFLGGLTGLRGFR